MRAGWMDGWMDGSVRLERERRRERQRKGFREARVRRPCRCARIDSWGRERRGNGGGFIWFGVRWWICLGLFQWAAFLGANARQREEEGTRLVNNGTSQERLTNIHPVLLVVVFWGRKRARIRKEDGRRGFRHGAENRGREYLGSIYVCMKKG